MIFSYTYVTHTSLEKTTKLSKNKNEKIIGQWYFYENETGILQIRKEITSLSQISKDHRTIEKGKKQKN